MSGAMAFIINHFVGRQRARVHNETEFRSIGLTNHSPLFDFLSADPLISLDTSFEWAASFSYPDPFSDDRGTPKHWISHQQDITGPEFGIGVGVALLFAYVFSLLTELHTEHLQSWLRSALPSKTTVRTQSQGRDIVGQNAD
ncbi:hypothetical protein [Bradyrhizobium australiense]|uniref:Uncharacterized protein n=1 Tax=Bradyrhizobium australiense TaxID=2721161 RepID=A0A7Y4GXD0_9BRAD|nr:hypothetical protein [Bradyrhizobium australiense]NOJ43683.1 hypothetical protein [Bradyrhizobium australiense]